MKIYRVIEDVNSYQGFGIDDESVWQSNLLTFDCSPKVTTWMPPTVHIHSPKLKIGSFIYLCPGALVLNAEATDTLRDLLEMSGELLPLHFKNETYHVLNVIECANVLDDDATKWVYGASTGAKIGIQTYAFHANRLLESPLFKIPETCKAEILTVEGANDPEYEFKGRVERLGLKGLRFEQIWESNS